MNTRSDHKRLCRSPIPCFAAIMLATCVMLIWSNQGFCGEIHDAVKSGDLERVKALLDTNPDLIFSKDDSFGATPLQWAALYGKKDLVELLLAKKADVNAKNNNGKTPLYSAAFNGHMDVVRLLLASNAEVNAKDNDGQTPLHSVAQRGNRDVAALLLSYKAEVNAKDKSGFTPLYLAVLEDHGDVAELLLENKADVNAKDDEGWQGWTPLHCAAFNGLKDVAELLLTNNADVNAKDKSGHTPLDYAQAAGNDAVAKLLRQQGGQDTANNSAGGGATLTGNIPAAKKDSVEGFYQVSDGMPDLNAYRFDEVGATISDSFASKTSGILHVRDSITIMEVAKNLAILDFTTDSFPIAYDRSPRDFSNSAVVYGKTASVVYGYPMSQRWFLTSDKGKVYCAGQLNATYGHKDLAILVYGPSVMQSLMNLMSEGGHPVASHTVPQDKAAADSTITVVSWDIANSAAIVRNSRGTELHVTLVPVSTAPSPTQVGILIAPIGDNH